MQSFLLRCARFALLLGVVAGACRAVNGTLLRYHLPVWSESPTILIAGDSHIAHGIDPSLIEGAVNVAQPAEPLVATYHKVALLVEAMPEVTTVVIGFAHHNLADYNDLKFAQDEWAHELFGRYYGIMDYGRVPDLPLNQRSLLRSRVRTLWTPNVHLLRDGWNALRHDGGNTHPYVGRFMALDYQRLESGLLSRTIQRHYSPDQPGDHISTLQLEYLERTVELLRDRQIEVVLLGTPTHDAYRAQVPTTFTEHFTAVCGELASREGVHCFDFTDALDDDRFFSDWDHLSRAGAERTTEMLRNDLSRRPAARVTQ